MKNKFYSAMLLCALGSGTAQASIATVDAELLNPIQGNYFSFHVDTTGDVNLYTSSSAPFDPFLTLWSATSATPTTADLTQLGANDNTTTWNLNESGSNAKDAQLKLNLTIGDYFARVTALGSDTFTYQFNVDTTNVAGTGATISNVGAAVAPVPLPAAVWLFGSGLVTFLGFSKRKGQKSII